MALTGSQKETISEKFTDLSIQGCPMCKEKNLTIGDEIVSANSVSLSGSTAIGGPFIPMAQLICTSCGFVSHHAIGVLGINLKD